MKKFFIKAKKAGIITMEKASIATGSEQEVDTEIFYKTKDSLAQIEKQIRSLLYRGQKLLQSIDTLTTNNTFMTKSISECCERQYKLQEDSNKDLEISRKIVASTYNYTMKSFPDLILKEISVFLSKIEKLKIIEEKRYNNKLLHKYYKRKNNVAYGRQEKPDQDDFEEEFKRLEKFKNYDSEYQRRANEIISQKTQIIGSIFNKYQEISRNLIISLPPLTEN